MLSETGAIEENEAPAEQKMAEDHYTAGVAPINRRKFLALLGGVLAGITLPQCAPPAPPRQNWAGESRDALQERIKATATIISAHDHDHLGQEKALTAATETFFDQAAEFKAEFSGAALAYGQNLSTVLKNASSELQSLAAYLFPWEKRMNDKAFFEAEMDKLIAQISTRFLFLARELFVWTGAIFSSDGQKEFLEGLLTKGLTKDRFMRFLLEDKDNTQQELRDALTISIVNGQERFLAHFLLPTILYFTGLDLMPSLQKNVGGMVRANYAALLAAITAATPDFYPPGAAITEKKPIFAVTPLRNTVGVSAMILSHPAMGSGGLTIADKIALLGGEKTPERGEKLRAVFERLLDLHRERLQKIYSDHGQKMLDTDPIYNLYFRNNHQLWLDLIKAIGQGGKRDLLAILDADTDVGVMDPGKKETLLFFAELLNGLFWREAANFAAPVCRDNFRHPLDRQKPREESGIGLPLPPRVTCLIYNF